LQLLCVVPAKRFVIVLEGDCTHAVGAVGGLAQAKGAPGIIWFGRTWRYEYHENNHQRALGGMPYAVPSLEFADWREALAGHRCAPKPPRSSAPANLDPAESSAPSVTHSWHIEASEMMDADNEHLD